ncbi:hypothetical protein CAOG_00246 [Capsaspora owczarzaki ATCC 30864]|uniref:PHD-type domain-containing protein n=1 Tax=Capsaspora owczarzaki (strain ATCC 30864) TaxID=595528 RepID=A0A0D2WGR1_CAPO3|nr:hypothetical protein CAOG_00246 [Capsaspora owczarzaki ATCC 30864]KJE88620.1 hypothetical protein, variant [Capsaspora owczarzaki ATCC 30864]|eukprot:XP_004365117.2 hypothetical protein CAOG_00246 [Capsaspora owczarzaki ATCC 30864]
MPAHGLVPFEPRETPAELPAETAVYHYALTGEVFTDYEEYAERVRLCTLPVWSCRITGKEHLTFQQAAESERDAIVASDNQKLLYPKPVSAREAGRSPDLMPEPLQPGLLVVVQKLNNSRMDKMAEHCYFYLKMRFFPKEEVIVSRPDGFDQPARIIRGISRFTGQGLRPDQAYGIHFASRQPPEPADPDQISTVEVGQPLNNSPLAYEVEWLVYRDAETSRMEGAWETGVATVNADDMRRQYTVSRESIRAFLRDSTDRVQSDCSWWSVKPEFLAKFNLPANDPIELQIQRRKLEKLHGKGESSDLDMAEPSAMDVSSPSKATASSVAGTVAAAAASGVPAPSASVQALLEEPHRLAPRSIKALEDSVALLQTTLADLQAQAAAAPANPTVVAARDATLAKLTGVQQQLDDVREAIKYKRRIERLRFRESHQPRPDEQLLATAKPLPAASPLSHRLSLDQIDQVLELVEFFYVQSTQVPLNTPISFALLEEAVITPAYHPLFLQLILSSLQLLLNDDGFAFVNEFGVRLKAFNVTPFTASEMLQLFLSQYHDWAASDVVARLRRGDLFSFSLDTKLHLLQFLADELTSCCLVQKYMDECTDKWVESRRDLREQLAIRRKDEQANKQPISRARPAASSPRSKAAAKGKAEEEDGSDAGSDAGSDDEAPTASGSKSESAAASKRKEDVLGKDLVGAVIKFSGVLHPEPIGTDRYHRRYFILRSTKGLFVQTVTETLDSDVPQTLNPSSANPLAVKALAASTNAPTTAATVPSEPLGLFDNTPEKLPVPKVQSQWQVYSTRQAVDDLLESLMQRGHRERALHKSILANYEHLFIQEVEAQVSSTASAAAVDVKPDVGAAGAAGPADSFLNELRESLAEIAVNLFEATLTNWTDQADPSYVEWVKELSAATGIQDAISCMMTLERKVNTRFFKRPLKTDEQIAFAPHLLRDPTLLDRFAKPVANSSRAGGSKSNRASVKREGGDGDADKGENENDQDLEEDGSGSEDDEPENDDDEGNDGDDANEERQMMKEEDATAAAPMDTTADQQQQQSAQQQLAAKPQELPAATRLNLWRAEVRDATSYSQLFVLLDMMESSLSWGAHDWMPHARCRVCRKRGHEQYMLLCDNCDYGYHMYCLLPVLHRVPNGSWLCPPCRPSIPSLLVLETAGRTPASLAVPGYGGPGFPSGPCFVVNQYEVPAGTLAALEAAEYEEGQRRSGRTSQRRTHSEMTADDSDAESEVVSAGEEDEHFSASGRRLRVVPKLSDMPSNQEQHLKRPVPKPKDVPKRKGIPTARIAILRAPQMPQLPAGCAGSSKLDYTPVNFEAFQMLATPSAAALAAAGKRGRGRPAKSAAGGAGSASVDATPPLSAASVLGCNVVFHAGDEPGVVFIPASKSKTRNKPGVVKKPPPINQQGTAGAVGTHTHTSQVRTAKPAFPPKAAALAQQSSTKSSKVASPASDAFADADMALAMSLAAQEELEQEQQDDDFDPEDDDDEDVPSKKAATATTSKARSKARPPSTHKPRDDYSEEDIAEEDLLADDMEAEMNNDDDDDDFSARPRPGKGKGKSKAKTKAKAKAKARSPRSRPSKSSALAAAIASPTALRGRPSGSRAVTAASSNVSDDAGNGETLDVEGDEAVSMEM